MKKFLKITAIILSLALIVFALGGCGEKLKSAIEDSGAVEKIEETAEKVSEKIEEKTFERGKWEDDVYTSEFANIKFRLPVGWEYSSDEEIAEMMNIGVEALNDDQQAMSKLAEQTSVYDMVANDPSTGASVMVMFEKTPMKVTTDFYIDKLKSGLEEVETLNYTIGDVTTENIGGDEYTVLNTTIPAYNMVQKYYVKQDGKYFIDILITYIEGKTELNSVLGNFE